MTMYEGDTPSLVRSSQKGVGVETQYTQGHRDKLPVQKQTRQAKQETHRTIRNEHLT